jgi:hypothetical protein
VSLLHENLRRGYFSGGEIEGRQRNVLRKRGSGSHSRNSSYTDEQRVRTGMTNARHSRFGSGDSFREPHLSPASQKYYGVSLRSQRPPSATSIPQPQSKDAPSPTVTKLDGNIVSSSPTDSPRSPKKMQSSDWLQAGNGIASPTSLGPPALFSKHEDAFKRQEGMASVSLSYLLILMAQLMTLLGSCHLNEIPGLPVVSSS